jgi:hypothetical protein
MKKAVRRHFSPPDTEQMAIKSVYIGSIVHKELADVDARIRASVLYAVSCSPAAIEVRLTKSNERPSASQSLMDVSPTASSLIKPSRSSYPTSSEILDELFTWLYDDTIGCNEVVWSTVCHQQVVGSAQTLLTHLHYTSCMRISNGLPRCPFLKWDPVDQQNTITLAGVAEVE